MNALFSIYSVHMTQSLSLSSHTVMHLTHSITTSDHMYPQVYLATEELGNSLDEVDALMKKHETVEKLLETQEQKARDTHIHYLNMYI